MICVELNPKSLHKQTEIQTQMITITSFAEVADRNNNKEKSTVAKSTPSRFQNKNFDIFQQRFFHDSPYYKIN